MPPAPGQEEPINRTAQIVNSFLAREDISPFAEPVDWRGLELFDYPEVIEKMMDLGTIKRRLERGQYNTAHEVGEDIRLVFTNCMTYNAEGSDFWLLAKSYLRRFEDRYRKIRYEFDVGEDDGKPSSSGVSKSKSTTPKETVPSVAVANTTPLDVRARFGANLFLLSGVELGTVFTDLELHCPEALESWGESKTEINVDAIPTKIFTRLQKYVNGLVGSTGLAQTDAAESAPKKKRRKS